MARSAKREPAPLTEAQLRQRALGPTEFATWREARDFAEARAKSLGVAMGIEKPTPYQGWTVKMLPRPESRYGWELRCEAVEVPVGAGED